MKGVLKVLTVVFVLTSSVSVFAEKLSIGWEPWAPYQYVDESGKLTGLDIDLLTAILDGANFEYDLVKRPWKRMLAEVKSGSIHIAPGASKTPEREEYAHFSLPYRNEQVVLLVSMDNKSKYAGLSSLKDFADKGFSIGVVREYYYGEDYTEMSKSDAYKGLFKEVSDDIKNFQKLLNNRIDAIMVDPVAAGVSIKENGWKGKFHTQFTVYSDDIFMMFSKQSVSKETIETINATLTAMKVDGRHQAILNEYLGQ